MPSTNFQMSNFDEACKALNGQIRKQEKFFRESQTAWEELTADLIHEVGIDASQIIPEFQTALGHIKKGINVQTAYQRQIESNREKLVQVDGKINNLNEDELEQLKREVDQHFNNDKEIHESRTKSVADHWDSAQFMGDYHEAKKYCAKVFERNAANDADEDDDMEMDMEGATAVPDKCPLTQKPYETPVPILACLRTCIFEKLAIKDYVLQKLGASGGQPIRCPNPGCQTLIDSVAMIHEGHMMSSMIKSYIKKQKK